LPIDREQGREAIQLFRLRPTGLDERTNAGLEGLDDLVENGSDKSLGRLSVAPARELDVPDRVLDDRERVRIPDDRRDPGAELDEKVL